MGRPDWWPCSDSGPASILFMCQELHMDRLWSSDCLTEDKRVEMIQSLQWVHRNWTRNEWRYDQAVQKLVFETLMERNAVPGVTYHNVEKECRLP